MLQCLALIGCWFPYKEKQERLSRFYCKKHTNFSLSWSKRRVQVIAVPVKSSSRSAAALTNRDPEESSSPVLHYCPLMFPKRVKYQPILDRFYLSKIWSDTDFTVIDTFASLSDRTNPGSIRDTVKYSRTESRTTEMNTTGWTRSPLSWHLRRSAQEQEFLHLIYIYTVVLITLHPTCRMCKMLIIETK